MSADTRLASTRILWWCILGAAWLCFCLVTGKICEAKVQAQVDQGSQLSRWWNSKERQEGDG